MRSKTMQGADLGLFHLLKRRPGPFAYLFSWEMVPGQEGGDHVIILLGQAKELQPEPLLHFSCGFVSEGESHDLRNSQRIRFSQQKVEDTVDEDRGLARPGSRDYHDIAVPGSFRQEPILGVCERQYITHHLLSAFSTGVKLGLGETDKSATRPWHRGAGRRLKIHSSRNSHREE